jgi:hypothetical protein
MQALFIVLFAAAILVTSHAIAQTRRARLAPACPPNCAAAPVYPTYPAGNTQWPSQRPAASGSYGAMLEGRNPASSAGF